MKKSLVAMSIACASALALADNPQWQTEWFKGIGGTASSALAGLMTLNGSWAGLADCAEMKDGALVLDVDTGAEALFSVTTPATDSATLQRLTIKGVFSPVAPEDLISGADMGVTKNAQIGFAVVEKEPDTYAYYAWIGGSGAETRIGDWVELTELGAVTGADQETALKIDLSYWTDDVKATFTIGGQSVTKALTGEALATARASKAIHSMACTGTGTLKELQGDYQQVVAQVGDQKFGTYDEAIAAGATDGEITQVKPIDGDVTAQPTDTSKEAVVENGKVIVQTATSVLEGVKPQGEKGLMNKPADFRAFLASNCASVYTKANVTSAEILDALQASGANSLKLWQSYALGVAPSTALTLTKVAGDTDAGNITLQLPVAPSGDYTVTYKVGSATFTDPAAIKVPMTTGRHTVKITIE